MEHKRRRELTRDMDRYLSSRKRRKINFKKLFRMPLELKSKVSKFKKAENTQKEESYYESHVQKEPWYQSIVNNIKEIFKKKSVSEEEYVEYQHVEKEKSQELKKEESKPKPKSEEQEFESSLKKTWFQAFIDIFKPSKEPDYASYPVAEEVKVDIPENSEKLETVKTDLKQVSKIALSAIKSMPKEHIAKFKNTSEFHEFKGILKKYNLIK